LTKFIPLSSPFYDSSILWSPPHAYGTPDRLHPSQPQLLPIGAICQNAVRSREQPTRVSLVAKGLAISRHLEIKAAGQATARQP
jgi:hypothetical protein